MGDWLILGGFFLIIFGILFNIGIKWPLLPGDVFIQRENFTFYFPIVSSIVISIILTIIFNLFKK